MAISTKLTLEGLTLTKLNTYSNRVKTLMESKQIEISVAKNLQNLVSSLFYAKQMNTDASDVQSILDEFIQLYNTLPVAQNGTKSTDKKPKAPVSENKVAEQKTESTEKTPEQPAPEKKKYKKAPAKDNPKTIEEFFAANTSIRVIIKNGKHKVVEGNDALKEFIRETCGNKTSINTYLNNKHNTLEKIAKDYKNYKKSADKKVNKLSGAQNAIKEDDDKKIKSIGDSAKNINALNANKVDNTVIATLKTIISNVIADLDANVKAKDEVDEKVRQVREAETAKVDETLKPLIKMSKFELAKANKDDVKAEQLEAQRKAKNGKKKLSEAEVDAKGQEAKLKAKINAAKITEKVKQTKQTIEQAVRDIEFETKDDNKHKQKTIIDKRRVEAAEDKVNRPVERLEHKIDLVQNKNVKDNATMGLIKNMLEKRKIDEELSIAKKLDSTITVQIPVPRNPIAIAKIKLQYLILGYKIKLNDMQKKQAENALLIAKARASVGKDQTAGR